MSSLKNAPSPPETSSPANPNSPPTLPGTMSEAYINQDLEIQGEFRSAGKLYLSGSIQGEVYCSSLIVTEEGKITGKIVADEVVIHGVVKGSIYGNSVDIFASSNVNGDVYHHGIGIEKGTKYDGTLKYIDDPIAAGEKASGS